MPVTTTYPGVYIEEIPSGVHTITGVATSIAAFVDFFARGPLNTAVRVQNMADFERVFGGLDDRSEASYAIQQFFLNGGGDAWVVRVSDGTAEAATAVIDTGVGGSTALTVEAVNPGAWGDDLRARVDPVEGGFNLTITEYQTFGGASRPVRSETYRGVTTNPADAGFVENVINGSSALVNVEAGDSEPIPAPNGTIGAQKSSGVTFTGTDPLGFEITIGSKTVTAAWPGSKPSGAQALTQAALLLQTAIRAAAPDDPVFAGATVEVTPDDRLRVLAGRGADPADQITFANTASDTTTVADLGLDTPQIANVQEYKLGVSSAVANSALAAGTAGTDGSAPGAAALIGDLLQKTGIYALEDVDLFNILCIPRTALAHSSPSGNQIDANEALAVISVAQAYCERRRAFAIVDPPLTIDTTQKALNWIGTNTSVRDKNAAVYWPPIQIPDPLNGFKLRTVGPSGTVAGIYARTDAARGVWKAPAGTETSLRNVPALDYNLTDDENGTLNPLAVNALRNFPVYGIVCWGARTLDGSDQQASEWKYVPVRRFALFLEESLYRGTKWVVFEPNDEPLWSQIRLNVGAFMHDLFRQGAFQGQTARDAYFVKCDDETTTQNDIDHGVVNIAVGFAPLKPAEFVVIQIQQLAGQIQT